MKIALHQELDKYPHAPPSKKEAPWTEVLTKTYDIVNRTNQHTKGAKNGNR